MDKEKAIKELKEITQQLLLSKSARDSRRLAEEIERKTSEIAETEEEVKSQPKKRQLIINGNYPFEVSKSNLSSFLIDFINPPNTCA